MWILAAMPLFFVLCRAHHGGGHYDLKSREIVELHEKLEQNFPRCKYQPSASATNQDTICEHTENEYPWALIQLIIGDYEKSHQQDTKDYSKFFDQYARYMKWRYESGLALSNACNMQYEEIFYPKVASTWNDTVFIVQEKPYIIKKIGIVKCLGSKDGIQECYQDYEEKKMVTLDKFGTIKPNIISVPFGCGSIEPPKTTTTTTPTFFT